MRASDLSRAQIRGKNAPAMMEVLKRTKYLYLQKLLFYNIIPAYSFAALGAGKITRYQRIVAINAFLDR